MILIIDIFLLEVIIKNIICLFIINIFKRWNIFKRGKLNWHVYNNETISITIYEGKAWTVNSKHVRKLISMATEKKYLRIRKVKQIEK